MMISDIIEDSFIITTLMPLDKVEELYIQHIIAQCGNNISKAARVLGLDRRTLYRKIQNAQGIRKISKEIKEKAWS